MIKKILAAVIILGWIATPAMAGDMPAKFKKCKMCHKLPGEGGKVGPDLITNTWTVDQWQSQVKNGSKWDGRPAKQEKYASKKMPKQKKVSEAEVQEIFDWVHSHK